MKEELSDFLKTAYKYGRVKDLSEAFEEFPIEEEWHKGKVKNILKEDIDFYRVNYNIGDIVFVEKYTYADGTIGTNHLFVIIDKDNTAVPIENIGMIISSNLNKLKFNANKLIKKDKRNNFNKNSIVKTDVVYRISNEQISFRIGKIDIKKVEEYKKAFYNSIKNES